MKIFARDNSTMATILIVSCAHTCEGVEIKPALSTAQVLHVETQLTDAILAIYTNNTPLVCSGARGSCHSLIRLCSPRHAHASTNPSVRHQELPYLRRAILQSKCLNV